MAPKDATSDRTRTRPSLFVIGITMLTVAIAFLSSDPITDRYLRPLFFAALMSFFVALGRREPGLRSLPYRLIEMSFLMLCVGSLGATFLREGPLRSHAFVENLAFALDRGVGFLLGLSMLSYGIVLWVPEVLESQRVLRENLARKRREAHEKGQALKKAEDLIVRQEALVTVGELSAGVAHELRNPLAILKSALQRLRSGDLDPAEGNRCLDVMERAVDKANRRISGLLDLGRATAFTPSCHSVRELLKNCVDLARPQARIAGVEIELREPEPNATFFGDADLMLQVLLNLTRNAVQAGPHDGAIRVSFQRGSDGGSRFTVEDRGRGIDEEHLKKLFTPFFTTKDDGTGLGLTVSANLIEKHEGRLWLEPNADRGVRACIELPPAAKAELGAIAGQAS